MKHITSLMILAHSRFQSLKDKEDGNLSLEHILFIVAVAGLGGAVSAFYSDIGAWFGSISLPSAPSF